MRSVYVCMYMRGMRQQRHRKRQPDKSTNQASWCRDVLASGLPRIQCSGCNPFAGVLLLASSHARTKLYRRQKATAGKTPAKNEKKMGNEHKKKKRNSHPVPRLFAVLTGFYSQVSKELHQLNLKLCLNMQFPLQAPLSYRSIDIKIKLI